MAGDKGEIDPYEEFFKPSLVLELLRKAHGGKPYPFKTPIQFSMMSPPSCTKFLDK